MIRTRLKLLASIGGFFVFMACLISWWGYQVMQTQQQLDEAIEQLQIGAFSLNIITLELLHDTRANLNPGQWTIIYRNFDEKIANPQLRDHLTYPFLKQKQQIVSQRFNAYIQAHIACPQSSSRADPADTCEKLLGRLRTQTRLALQDLLVEISKTEEDITSQTRRQNYIGGMLLLMLPILMSLLTVALVLPMTRSLTNGMTKLLEASKRFRLGDFGFRVEVDNQDEMGTLARTYNDMALRREEAEKHLQESEGKFRNLVESSQDWIWEINAQGVYTYASPLCRTLLGYAPEEIIGRTPFDLMPETEAQRVQAEFQSSITNTIPIIALENTNLHKDGRKVILETSGVPFFDEQGKLLGYRGMDRDITERKQVDLELKHEYDRTRLILETTLDGYILADTSGQLLDMNPAYCKLVGYTRDELLCMNIRQLEVTLSDDEVNVRIQSMLAAGGARFETRHRHKDGHQVELDVNIAVMHGHETPLMAAFVRDITERNKADANLHYRLRLEAALAKVSSNLMQADEERLDSTIDKALEHIGTVVDADRSYFFQIDDVSQTFSNTHEWCAEGVEAQQPELQQVLTAESQAAFIRFKQGMVLHVPTPHDLDVELAPLREHMQQTGIHSLINVPVLWEGQLRGVLGFDSEKTHKIWPEEDIQLLHTVADSFGSALARQESSQGMREHTWFLESLDKVFRLLSGQTDTTLLLQKLTALMLEILGVDRAWLLRPCNPQAPTFQIPIESTRAEFPGAAIDGAEIPMDEFTAELIRQSLNVDHPLVYQCKEVMPAPEYSDKYQIQSIMVIVLHPHIGDPWLLSVYQCAYQRVWTQVEQQLFQTIAERVTTALSGKLLLEQVQASERRMLEAERIAQMGEWELDIATGQAKWTDLIHHIFGTDPSQEVGPAFLSTVVNPDDWPDVSSSLNAAMERGEKHEMEYRIYRSTGEERWLYCKAHRDLDAKGNPCKLTGIVQDITERKQAEIYLRESEARYRVIFNQQFQFMAILSPDGTTLDINELPLRMTGSKREDIVGKPFWQSPAWKNLPEWQEIWKKRLTQAASMNGPVITEDIYQTADGSIRQADCATTAICNDKGAIVFYLIQASDTTDRRRAEQERSKLMQEIQQFNEDLEQRVHERTSELEAVNKELESFSYSVSHDLRTPLRAIDGFSLALAEDYGDQLDGTAHDYLQRVRNGAQRMGILIDDLLQLSRVNRGELIRKEVDLGKLAEAVLAELRAGEPDRQVELILDSNMQVKGDPQLLRVILDNLLGNAWKFTAREAVSHITLKRKTDQPGVFYISDNGVGFDMRHADKLFGAFQRLHRTIEFPGTGVGLATVQRIIHRHGGRIWAEAQEGEGASFYFTLGPM